MRLFLPILSFLSPFKLFKERDHADLYTLCPHTKEPNHMSRHLRWELSFFRTTDHSDRKVSGDHPVQPSAQSRATFRVMPSCSDLPPVKFSISPGMEVQQPPWARAAVLDLFHSEFPPCSPLISHWNFRFHNLWMLPLVLSLCTAEGSATSSSL